MFNEFNHIAVTVTDIHAAQNWYKNTMNFEPLTSPTLINAEGNDASAQRLRAIFGSKIRKLWMCHMLSANGAGIELFEFVEPKSVIREDNLQYWKTGFFHMCITDAKIRERARKIVETGGKQRTELFEIQPGKWICFCEDPFGNVIEIYSKSYEDFWRGQ